MPILLALLVPIGCTAVPVAGDDAGLTVERIASSRFEIAQVDVQPHLGALTVRGTVSRKIPRRGALPGSVRISLVAPDGTLLETTDATLMRPNRQARSAHFHARLAFEPPTGGTVRVEHVY